MGLSLTVNNALSGLAVNRESLATLSNNIANANNPDFSRQSVQQGSVTLDGIGAGVRIEDVTRSIDNYLQQAVRDQTGVVGRTETLNTYAERLQLLLGSPGQGTGINSQVTNLFNALQSLAETPEQSSNRVNVLNAAETLTTEVQLVFDGLQQLRFDADQEIQVSVNAVNERLNELFTLNSAISNAGALGRPVSSLLDQRDAAIRDIAEHVDINVFFNQNQTVNIYAAGGANLLDVSLYELEYTPISSPNSLLTDDPQFSPIRTFVLDGNGDRIRESTPLATGGSSDEVSTGQQQGAIRGLIDVRDENLTNILEQLDSLTAAVRDEVNAIHNEGSGFPGATSLTGTRPITAGSVLNFQGEVRFALVDINGLPVPSPYSGEDSAFRPLTIDLSSLDSGLGNGPGFPSVQSILDEFNQHFGPPQNRVSLGSLNNIELTATSQRLPGNFLDFDFDLENISGADTDFFVTGVTVLDDNATDITNVSNTAPAIGLNAANTYTTTAGSSTVSIAANNHGLAEGDLVFLPTPSVGVDNIPANQLGGFFQVANVTANGFEINTDTVAANNATLSEGGTAIPRYVTSESGTQVRTTDAGGFRADIGANTSSSFYDVSVNVSTVAEDGSIETSTINYRVTSNNGNTVNQRYGASSANGSGEIEVPNQIRNPLATATLVDANGQEIGQVNNRYLADVEGFLKIEVNGTQAFLSIDSLDSLENGNPNASPFVVPGSQRGFSHFFELNNFFASNNPIGTGDTRENSARNFEVESRISDNPGNISTGRLVRSPQPTEVGADPVFTYERIAGDDSIAQRLADLATNVVTFDSAGGLGSTSQSISGYAGEILGFVSSDANSLESNFLNSQIILTGFVERSAATTGVNVDEELANTVLFQNAFSASARVITVANELFETLLNSF